MISGTGTIDVDWFPNFSFSACQISGFKEALSSRALVAPKSGPCRTKEDRLSKCKVKIETYFLENWRRQLDWLIAREPLADASRS